MSFSMLRLVCLSFLLIFNVSSVNAGSDSVSPLQPLANQSLVLDMVKAGQTSIAVGERGHLFVYQDGWQQQASPTSAHLTKATLFNDSLGWAVGHDATILHTKDAGITWQLQMSSPEIEKPFMDLLQFNEKQGIAIGAYGLFYRTEDGGVTWESEFHSELLFEEDKAYLEELRAEDEALYLSESSTLLPHFNRVVQLDDKRLLMVGELGLAAVSQDFGRTWQRLEFPYEGSLFNILVSQHGIYVMGLRGHLFKSVGGLDDWQEVEMPVQSTLNGGIVLNEDVLRLVGNAGVVVDIKQDDSVKMVTQRQGENLVTILVTSDGKQWVAGTKGFIELEQE